MSYSRWPGALNCILHSTLAAVKKPLVSIEADAIFKTCILVLLIAIFAAVKKCTATVKVLSEADVINYLSLWHDRYVFCSEKIIIKTSHLYNIKLMSFHHVYIHREKSVLLL